MAKHEFNGKTYAIECGDDGFYSITRDDGKSFGCSASFSGAIYACTLDAWPSAPRDSLRRRPDNGL